MTEKTEALRLAEFYEALAEEPPKSPDNSNIRAAAAELRRLSAENERLAAEVANRNRRALAGDEAVAALANVHAHYECLEAQRDALLEALELAADFLEHSTEFRIGHPGFEGAQAKARAAIKAVEGEKT